MPLCTTPLSFPPYIFSKFCFLSFGLKTVFVSRAVSYPSTHRLVCWRQTTEIYSYYRLPGSDLVANHQDFRVTTASNYMKAVIFFRNIGTEPPGCMAPQYAQTSVFKRDQCAGFNLPTCHTSSQAFVFQSFSVSMSSENVIALARDFKENVKDYKLSVLMNSIFPIWRRLRLKCDDGTRTDTRFRLSAKRTSQFESAGTSVQATTGNRGVHISGSNARYTKFRGSVKGTGYSIRQFPLHFPFRASPCAITFHLDSTTVYVSKKLLLLKLLLRERLPTVYKQ